MVNDNDIAVVGMACVFPGAATLRQYWANIVNAVDAVGAPPPGRWRGAFNFGLPAEHEA
ncbi:MAG: hypothetical protein J2P46_19140, partial [Zavarzinella sp.]|nr:hypothetical protein [Zavarzinella sp.]